MSVRLRLCAHADGARQVSRVWHGTDQDYQRYVVCAYASQCCVLVCALPCKPPFASLDMVTVSVSVPMALAHTHRHLCATAQENTPPLI